MNYTVFESGGKQYLARNGDVIRLEKLEQREGSEIVFDKVLLSVEGDKVVYGAPYIKQQTLRAQVVRHGRDKKIRIVKFKRRKHSLKRQGHRQWFTEVRILAPDKAGQDVKAKPDQTTRKTAASVEPKQAATGMADKKTSRSSAAKKASGPSVAKQKGRDVSQSSADGSPTVKSGSTARGVSRSSATTKTSAAAKPSASAHGTSRSSAAKKASSSSAVKQGSTRARNTKTNK